MDNDTNFKQFNKMKKETPRWVSVVLIYCHTQ